MKYSAVVRPEAEEDLKEAFSWSWQRGTNEHMNGLVRWYFPKGTDFGKITEEQVVMVESLINTRPRKCLGYKTPLEVASVALRD